MHTLSLFGDLRLGLGGCRAFPVVSSTQLLNPSSDVLLFPMDNSTAVKITDLANFKLEKGPPSIFYIPDFITAEDEASILDKIYKAPKPKWTQLSSRRLQNWGGLPHPKGMVAEKIPQWLNQWVETVNHINVFGGNKANHVLVNEYLSGQGIMPHLDGPLFYPTITTINLGSHTILNFYSPIKDLEENLVPDFPSRLNFSLLLKPRSLLILQDHCYNTFLHGIDPVTEDIITDKVINSEQLGQTVSDKLTRTTRVSLTIRHVPKTTKSFFQLKGAGK